MARAAWRMPGYRIEELLGAGSSGEVWRARVVATGVAVAVKRIWLSSKAQRTAALAEAAMLSALDHPHLMKLHDVRHVDDDIVLVLDLASGGSLASLLDRRGRLTVGEVVTAIAPIGAALAYAHNADVVHGDVSAGNIVFTDIGLPLLADLGVARILGDATPVRTTPVYADPMVVTGALPTSDSDVFMLGGVALHALTGAAPWPAHVSPEALDEVTAGEDPGFADRLAEAGVPEPVTAVVTRALSIEPARRGTAEDFALDLRHAAEPVAVELSAGRAHRAPLTPLAQQQPLTYGVRAPAPFGDGPGGRHQAPVGRRRVPAGLAVATVVLALVLAAALWWLRRPSHHARAVAARASTMPASVATYVPVTTSSRPTAVVPASADAILASLDRTRSLAYARRDPALLATVYDSSALLARDRAMLLTIVPTGCGLRGVHTRFTGLSITSRSAGHLQLSVTEVLAPSVLVCGRTASGRAAGTDPTPLVVDVVRVGARYRIAAQRSA